MVGFPPIVAGYPHTAADGGTAVLCYAVVQVRLSGGAAPAAERGALGADALH